MLFFIVPFIVIAMDILLIGVEYVEIGYVSRVARFSAILALVLLFATCRELGDARKRNIMYQNESAALLELCDHPSMAVDSLARAAEYNLIVAEAHKHNVRYAERLNRQDAVWDGYKYRIGYSDKRIDKFIHPFGTLQCDHY